MHFFDLANLKIGIAVLFEELINQLIELSFAVWGFYYFD
jgi:hypothetical protein